MKRQKGFTLIELLIIVAITGILCAIAIPQFAYYRISEEKKELKAQVAATIQNTKNNPYVIKLSNVVMSTIDNMDLDDTKGDRYQVELLLGKLKVLVRRVHNEPVVESVQEESGEQPVVAMPAISIPTVEEVKSSWADRKF